MSGVIVHCPGCGGALMVNPRVTHTLLHNSPPHLQRLDVTFAVAQIDHACPDEENR